MSSPADTLSFIRDLLSHIEEEEMTHLLATTEDATYFRNLKRKPQNIEIKKDKPKPTQAVNTTIRETVSPPAVTKVFNPPITIAPPIQKATPPPPIPSIKEIKSDLKSPLQSFGDLRKIIATICPELAIINEIPSDTIAHKISERWKTKNQTAPISILSYHEEPEQRALLEQIAKALDIYFGPAKIINAEQIEKEKQWDAFLSADGLKMVIVCDYTLWQLGSLMHFYKENPAQGSRTLKTIPLFLLPDLSLYLKDPLLKRSLWKALCQKFS